MPFVESGAVSSLEFDHTLGLIILTQSQNQQKFLKNQPYGKFSVKVNDMLDNCIASNMGGVDFRILPRP